MHHMYIQYHPNYCTALVFNEDLELVDELEYELRPEYVHLDPVWDWTDDQYDKDQLVIYTDDEDIAEDIRSGGYFVKVLPYENDALTEAVFDLI